MQKDTIVLFVRYNKLANKAMNEIIKTLSPQEWNKPLGGYFPSVRGLCSHLYISDFNWLKRFRNLREFSTLKDPFFDRGYAFKDLLFEDMGEYFSGRSQLDDRLTAFAAEITDEDLTASFRFTDSSGKSLERNFGGACLQFLNHETHHRGMISLYLELLGRENDFSSFGQALKPE
ncbi:MAG: DinB family protein [Treponema sp.]|nr:DinB family protein [Treponema sp.]